MPSPFGMFYNVTYRVSRADLGSAPLTEINGAVIPPGYPVNAPPPVAFAHRAPLDNRTAYTYTITAFYSRTESTPVGSRAFDDGCGITQVSVRAPRPGTPDITSVVPGPGRVSVSWSMAAQGQTGFLILGAGLPQEGREFPASAGSAEISGLQPGTHTWLLAPFWDTPGGRMIDASTGRSLSATVK